MMYANLNRHRRPHLPILGAMFASVVGAPAGNNYRRTPVRKPGKGKRYHTKRKVIRERSGYYRGHR